MKKILLCVGLALLFSVSACMAQNQNLPQISEEEISGVLKSLSADDMRGRSALNLPDITKAVELLASEFKNAGLQTFNKEADYLQRFQLKQSIPKTGKLSINGKEVRADDFALSSNVAQITLDRFDKKTTIARGDDFFKRFTEINTQQQNLLVLIDPSFRKEFGRLKNYLAQGNNSISDKDYTVLYVLANEKVNSLSLTYQNEVKAVPMFNVLGVLPGKSRPNEYVIFSAHYDHIGILDAVAQDSIANGADDDASGVASMIALAKYFAQEKNNERSLIFVAFTAEEMGGYGSQFFSMQLNPADVIAMFNIEMVGKVSKWGKNSAFITGYERSDFGEILQKNLEATSFRFHPDPYPEQNLFFRSDNKTLARLGVPAHTISTVQIDKDKFYHSVDDEMETLDLANLTEITKAIALSAKSIISGADTPNRIEDVGE